MAPVTIDNNDFVFADVYARARASGDRATMESVPQTYVPYMEGVTVHFENLSRQFLGYEVKQILLLHANELNADYVGDLITMLRNRGYRFITLDEALEDPAYALAERHQSPGAPPVRVARLHDAGRVRRCPSRRPPHVCGRDCVSGGSGLGARDLGPDSQPEPRASSPEPG